MGRFAIWTLDRGVSPGTIESVSYPVSLLSAGEEVRLDTHPHWASFIPAGLWVVGAGVVSAGAASLGWTRHAGVSWTIWAVWAVTAVIVVRQVLTLFATDFVVTTSRIIFRSGVLARHS